MSKCRRRMADAIRQRKALARRRPLLPLGGRARPLLRSPARHDRSPGSASPGPSIAQSLGYRPSATHLVKLEYGQSAGRAARQCFTGLQWQSST